MRVFFAALYGSRFAYLRWTRDENGAADHNGIQNLPEFWEYFCTYRDRINAAIAAYPLLSGKEN